MKHVNLDRCKLIRQSILVLVVLLVLTLAPATAQSDETSLWSANLTVSDIADGSFKGCDFGRGASSSCPTNLTDHTFSFDGVDYEIKTLSIGSATLGITLDKTIPDTMDNLVLHVAHEEFVFAHAIVTDSTQRCGRYEALG